MKFFIFFLFSFSCIVSPSLAQNTMGTQTQGVDFNSYPLGTIDTFDKRVKDLEGTPYLYENYRAVKLITTFNDTITLKQSRYNLFSNSIEFLEDDFNKFLSAKYIKSLYFYDAIDNCMCDEYEIIESFDSSLGNKLFKVLYEDDQVTIAELKFAVIDKANYNAALDMGKPQDEIKVRSKLYLLKGTFQYELEVSKNKFSKYFNNPKQVKKELKKYDYSYTNPNDLLKILDKFDLNS